MQRLVGLLPDALVKFFARPYVAGDSLEQGLEVTRQLLASRGILTTFDLLSENIESESAVEAVRATYRRMIDACAGFADPATRPTVSLKPSSFTLDPLGPSRDGRPAPAAAGSEAAIRELVAAARQRGVRLTIDMEDRHWTQWTLDLARRLLGEGQDHVGIVLQTRLHRTGDDLKQLPQGLRVRLVIGIYREPPEAAIQDKPRMKERMLEAARYLLERGHYVEFATHDVPCVRRFLGEVVPATGVGAQAYEVQMLYGVPLSRFQDDLRAGRFGGQGPVGVRLYVPFATSWQHALAYCRRRLLENPSMAAAVARNLARVVLGRR